MAMQGASTETAATPAAESPPDGGSTTPSTPSPTAEFDAEAIAARPEITEAFSAVFGSEQVPAGEGPKPTPRPGQSPEENAEELEGLEGTKEVDDGIEPEEDKVAGAKGKDDTAGARVDAEGGAEEGAGKAEAPTLNPLLRHAARRAGWSDKDIDELAASKPELADMTFKKLLGSFNDLSAQYGRLGQMGPPAAPAAPYAAGGYAPGAVATPQAQPQAQPPPNLLQQLYGDNLPSFKEKYGPDFVAEILSPLVAPIQSMMETSDRQRTESIGKEIGEFFKGLPEEFSGIYGAGAQVTDVEQFAARRSVAMRADQIRRGASAQGIGLSVSECLEGANMEFAAGHMATLERKRITDEIKGRSGQITERPTQTGAPAGQPAERSIEAAQAAYAQHAAELGYGTGGYGG